MASDAVASDVFGSAVDVSGNWAIIGAPGAEDGAIQSAGAVYFFERVSGVWIERHNFLLSDFGPGGAAQDQLGTAVAIDGTRAIATRPGGDGIVNPDTGAALGFRLDAGVWIATAGIFPSDGQPNDRFGVSVALDGVTDPIRPRAIIGATSVNSGQGAAYFYTDLNTGSIIEQKVFSSDGAAGDGFGQRVDFDGDTAIVGASGANGAATDSGAAYIFTNIAGTWTEQQKLFAPDGAPFEFFGWSVALDGDTAVVSTDSDADFGVESGSAHIFARDGDKWVLANKIYAPDAAPFEYFSWSVAIDGGTILVGAESGSGNVPYSGSAYFFEGAFGFGGNTTVRNLTAATTSSSLPSALGAAASADLITPTYGALRESTNFDFAGKNVDAFTSAEIRTTDASVLTLSDGVTLSTPPGRFAHFLGDVVVPPGASATIDTDEIVFGPGGVLDIGVNATLDGNPTSGTKLQRAVTLLPGSALLGGATVTNKDVLTLAGAVLASNGSTINDQSVIVQDVSQIIGDYTNNGVTTIQNGTLTVLGALTDNGTIVGDFGTTRAGAGGFFVENDYSARAGSTLSLLGGVAKFGMDADIAINDNTRFDMATSEVRMVGLEGTSQTFERMSTDIGADPDGLDRTIAGHYPLATLRIGPAGTTVNLVDIHDNDNLGQGSCEAVYVSSLIIDVGATLNTDGCPVYYETLSLNGSVDNPANLIEIGGCPADLSGDNTVNGADLAILLASWGTPNSPADLSGDGNVDGADLAVLLANWGPCN
jgi:hypothetical protein